MLSGCEFHLHSCVPGSILTRRPPPRTCKYFSSSCAPALFRSIHLDEAKLQFHQRILENLGHLVRDLTLNVKCGLDDNEEQPIYDILWYLPHIRSLTVIHEREDIASHMPLKRALDRLQHLEAVTLLEKDYDSAFPYLTVPEVEVSQTLFHRFLENVLNVHGRRLQALHIYTLLPLDQALYIKIRDETPNLRSVTFSGNITVALRKKFGEPTPWASGQTGSLKSLIFDTCEGAHAGYFAHNVLRGVYGKQLMEAGIIACGANDDERFVPFTPIDSIGSIDHFFIDHMFSWEMEALSRIPTRDLSFTRLIPDNFIQLPKLLSPAPSDSDLTRVGFRGLKRLRLSRRVASHEAWEAYPDECRTAYEELKDKYLPQRGIHLSLDATGWPDPCTSHPHM